MAIRLNVVGEKLSRATGIVSGANAYTCMVWWKRTASVAGYRTIFSQAAAALAKYVGIYDTPGPNGNFLEVYDGSTDEFGETNPSETDVWYHFAYTRSGSTHKFYCMGGLFQTLTLDMSAAGFTTLSLGDEGTTHPTNAQLMYFRDWTATLSEAQIQAEMLATSAVLSTNLNSDVPLTSDALDISGHGFDFTTAGAVDYVASPTLSGLTLNNAPSGATEILFSALPLITTQDSIISGVSQGLYYKLVNDTGEDKVYTAWFYGQVPDAGGYTTQWSAYSDVMLTLLINSNFTNAPLEVQILAGTTHWFQMPTSSPSASPATLNINVSAKPTGVAIVSGQIAIRTASTFDWTIEAGLEGFQVGIIDPATSTIINFWPQLIVGEHGDILPNGRMLFDDEYDSMLPAPVVADDVYVNLYDLDFTFLTRFLVDSPSLGVVYIKTNIVTGKFWCAVPGTSGRQPYYFPVDEDGVKGSNVNITIGSGPVNAIATNPDETIMYFATSVLTCNIKRWDMVGHAFLSDLAADEVGFKVADLLCLSDGNIVVLYLSDGAAYTTRLKIFQPDGTLLHTYNPTFAATLTNVNPRLGHTVDDPDYFWMWDHLTTGRGVARKVKVSDGTYLLDSTTPDVIETGIETLSPSLIYTSDSCPIVELVAPVLSPGSITVNKVLVPTGPTQSFDFTTGGGLSPGSFSLVDGGSQNFAGVPAGSGYSVTETPNSHYDTEYTVSNGSPHTNITVGDGEAVTVTVTNTLKSAIGSGIYKIVPGANKRNDTLWNANTSGTTDVKIPDPHGVTGYIGD